MFWSHVNHQLWQHYSTFHCITNPSIHQAIRLGNVNALCDLGVCLKVGRGVELDTANAREHLALAAAKGHPDAAVLLHMDHPLKQQQPSSR